MQIEYDKTISTPTGSQPKQIKLQFYLDLFSISDIVSSTMFVKAIYILTLDKTCLESLLQVYTNI